jgi:Protein of unknown function (DUF3761).
MKSLRTLLAVAGLVVISASTASAQARTVACVDGTRSAGGRGACSGHGGVQTAARKADAKADAKAAKADAKAAKPEAKADAKVAKVDAKADAKVAKADAKAAKIDAKADAKVTKADAKEDEKADRDSHGATAECKDHTYSHAKSHQGACSRHGGVARFLTGK